MSEQINATCTICGNGYHMCLSCKDKKELSPWKMYTDTAEHFKIHQIIHGFSTGVYDRNEVKNKLKNVDLSDLDTFKPNIKLIIEDVLNEEVIENVVDNEKVEGIIKSTISRKRNYKVKD
jgi:hypothetical protein